MFPLNIGVFLKNKNLGLKPIHWIIVPCKVTPQKTLNFKHQDSEAYDHQFTLVIPICGPIRPICPSHHSDQPTEASSEGVNSSRYGKSSSLIFTEIHCPWWCGYLSTFLLDLRGVKMPAGWEPLDRASLWASSRVYFDKSHLQNIQTPNRSTRNPGFTEWDYWIHCGVTWDSRTVQNRSASEFVRWVLDTSFPLVGPFDSSCLSSERKPPVHLGWSCFFQRKSEFRRILFAGDYYIPLLVDSTI